MKQLVMMLACAIGASASSAAIAAVHQVHADNPLVGHELSGQARITLPRARMIALKARPGIIIDQELEKEGGGSGLRYSFDVRSRGRIFEVGIDAKTGRVLEHGAETAAKEAAEVKADAKARRH